MDWFSSIWRVALVGAAALAVSILHASDTQSLADRARALQAAGKLEDAARAWKEVADRNVADPTGFANLGIVLAQLGRYGEAVQADRQALRMDPRNAQLHLNLGLAYFKAGNFRAALEPFRIAAGALPSDPQPRILLGMSEYGAGDFAASAQDLERAEKSEAAERQPPNAQLRQILAQSYLWSGRYRDALRLFDSMLREDPEGGAVHVLLGEALDGMGKLPEAIAEFEEAARHSPDLPNVHFGLGYLYWKNKQLDRAEGEFRAELTHDPQNGQAMAYLGDVMLRNGNQAEARRLLDLALKQRGDIRIAYYDLGVLFAGELQNTKALEAFRKAIELDPAKADAHYRVAKIYRLLGQDDLARGQLIAVRKLHSDANQDLVHRVSGGPPALSQ